jgi:exonuclease III
MKYETNTVNKIETGNIVHSAAIGGLGGILPTLSSIAGSAAANPNKIDIISLGHLTSMFLYFIVGFILCYGMRERRLKESFLLGIAAPAIIMNLVSGATSSEKPQNLTFNLGIIPVAHAQVTPNQESVPSKFMTDFKRGLGFNVELESMRREYQKKEKELNQSIEEVKSLEAKITSLKENLQHDENEPIRSLPITQTSSTQQENKQTESSFTTENQHTDITYENSVDVRTVSDGDYFAPYALDKTNLTKIKVASWNIGWLGSHVFNKRTDADYELLAEYAKRLNADVIALQEVEDENWASKIFGYDYDYYFTTTNLKQRVGVAVKKSLGFQVSSKEYKALNVGRIRRGMDITLLKGDSKFRLLAVHLKSGCFSEPLDKVSIEKMPNKSNMANRRKAACYKLSQQIEPLESWIDQRAQEGVPFAVIGVFNRRFGRDIASEYSENSGLWQAIDDYGTEDMWAPTIEKDSHCWGGYYKELIDHIVLDPRAKEHYVSGSFKQLVYHEKYSKKASQSLSDHCPISVELTI